MAHVDGRQVFEPFQAALLKALLVLVELRPRHASLSARLADVAQRYGEPQKLDHRLRCNQLQS